MKTLLIITGPQGSGNHLFSKIFAASDSIFGWSELNDSYWVPHDQEPFAEAWNDPRKLKDVHFDRLAVTSISCPYAYFGKTVEPDYDKFINEARSLRYDVKLAIIGRDQNVLRYQQTRVRRTYSYPRFENQITTLSKFNPVFLSTELLYLYRMHYVNSLSTLLGFDFSIAEEKLDHILSTDPNAKYFTEATEQELDKLVRSVSGL